MPARVQFKLNSEDSYFSLPINPREYDDKNNRIINQSFAIDGSSIVQSPVFDGRTRSFTWVNLPNKAPYNTMIAQLASYVNAGTVNMRLRDLSGSEGNTVVTNITVLDVATAWAGGSGPPDATSKLKYSEVIMYYTINTVE